MAHAHDSDAAITARIPEHIRKSLTTDKIQERVTEYRRLMAVGGEVHDHRARSGYYQRATDVLNAEVA